MKLPPDSIIARAKVIHYLLVPQAKGDKSHFLALAGYDLSHQDQLIHDLLNQVLPHEAKALRSTEHGQYFEIQSPLTGPNGRTLKARTIWMKEHLSQQTKFITLIPERNRNS
jgi:hypothetical protein